jgi:hypothetical protein
VWFIGGLFLDGWAHNNGRVDNTFFTPWHAVLYSGYAAVGALMVITQFRNVTKGYAWTRALPRGYLLSLLGVILFGFGGGFDFWWHSTFGFEANVEALLSPAHLLLATGAMLFVSGPLRAAWGRRNADTPAGWAGFLPAFISLLGVLSLLTFFTQYSHFFNSPGVMVYPPQSDQHFFYDVFGVDSILIPAAILMSVVLFALRRWTLPVGAITLLFTINSALMFFMRQGATEDFPLLLIVPVVGGVFADVLALWLKPSPKNVEALRLFAFVVPFAMFTLYFILLNQIGLGLEGSSGLWWKIHMWLGTPVLAGAAGLFLSFLVAPPSVPAE